ncbi:STN domain-containing protein [Kordiimonas aestuarii]|uniref:STN domain-containing protein n=1 Tax=Kordiimonas aestuarii TaxID=1005925 RepID=UPI0021D1AAC5|nr:STN domain-containing protein [Kordiimonas aestuarii]
MMQGPVILRAVKALLFLLLLTSGLARGAVASDERQFSFDIPAQPLTAALLKYSEQAGVQLILAVDTRELPPCAAIRGRMSAQAAIARILNETGLEFYFSSPNTVTVRRLQNIPAKSREADKLKPPPKPA